MLTINSVFDNETKNSIQESIRNFKNLSMSLNETTENLHSLISDNSNSIDKSLKNIELTSENLSVITENISEANIKDLINNINSTVTGFNSIINKANEGKGSVSKFLENDAVFNNLENATLELEVLINDIKTNPNRYVHFSIFGKKPKKN
jgi:phospholipid/cholesterol/gamma-HCH transport system substrate-binding protein